MTAGLRSTWILLLAAQEESTPEESVPGCCATPTPTPTETPAPTPTTTPTSTPTLEKSIPGRFAAEPPPAVLVSAHYVYNGDGNLVKTVVNSVVAHYPGRDYNLEVDGEMETVKKFYAVGNLTFAVRTILGEQDTLHWILSDHLGSLNVTANEDGTWNSEMRWKDGITPTDYRFTGQLEQRPNWGHLDYFPSLFSSLRAAAVGEAILCRLCS
ncbi:MAG: hypothetical protein HPY59_01460 [Anaerolineae bacterium]|nr:hypothetical protein [Anaerolineae bacterium]